MFVAARYTTKIRSSSNASRYSICDASKGRAQMLQDFIRKNGVSLLLEILIHKVNNIVQECFLVLLSVLKR